MSTCHYDPATFHKETRPLATKVHVCSECQHRIQPGERYERVVGVWDDRMNWFNTCVHCLAARDEVESLTTCFCWAHGRLRGDIKDWLMEAKLPMLRKLDIYRLIAKTRSVT